MVVPRLSVLPRGSFTIENEAESDSQIYCSSSLCLDVTTTRSATRHKEMKEIKTIKLFSYQGMKSRNQHQIDQSDRLPPIVMKLVVASP